ncbi:MAG: hypothetical protein RL323_2374 [Pseudomonadota bacterium]
MHPRALLDLSAELLASVLKFDQATDAVVAQFGREHRNLGPRERHWLADVVYRVLREKPLLEWLAQSQPLPLAQAPAKPGPHRKGPMVTPARLALNRQLAILAMRSDEPWQQQTLNAEEQAWLASCSALLAPSAGATTPPQAQHLLPTWLAQRLQKQLPHGFDALAASLNLPATLDLRVNPLKHKRQAVQPLLAQEGVQAEPTPYAPLGLRVQGKPSLQKLKLFTDGVVEVQDEGSQLLTLLLEAKRNETVVDFCAGAGGKTLGLGVAMRNTGRLYAFDTSAHRLEALQPRLQRSGLTNVHTMVIGDEADPRLQRMWGKVDRVLVDAPCSGLGTLRRSPDLKWRQTAKTVDAMPELQLRILESAAKLLKPGGRLVYATCSLLQEENEAVVQAFGQAQREFVPVDAAAVLQHAGVSHAAGLCQAGNLRLWPHIHGTDGFFAAIWAKKL